MKFSNLLTCVLFCAVNKSAFGYTGNEAQEILSSNNTSSDSEFSVGFSEDAEKDHVAHERDFHSADIKYKGRRNHRQRRLVFDGQSVDDSTFPFMARIETFTRSFPVFCGGTLIAKNVILTAASCIWNNERNAPFIDEVKIGNSLGQRESFQVVQRATHPDWRGSINDGYDAMLLLLDRDADRDVVVLDNCGYDWIGSSSNILGWWPGHGNLFSHVDTADETDTGLSIVDCQDGGGLIPDQSVICAQGGPNRGGYNDVDGGGPLLVRSEEDWDVQVGIISESPGSNFGVEGSVQRYTRISSVYRWIARRLRKEWNLEWPERLCKPIVKKVADQCLAPAPGKSNACSIRSTLPSRGYNGADITWEVTLFFNTEWRVQFQAFSETSLECQYEMRVKGSYKGDGVDKTSFKTKQSISSGITPTKAPQLTLLLDEVKIWPARFSCE